MSPRVDACRESCVKACKAAHIGGCIAAIVVILAIIPAKLWGYLPASVTPARLMLFPVLAYGLGFGAMLWKLGRAIKRSQAMADDAAMATNLQRRAG